MVLHTFATQRIFLCSSVVSYFCLCFCYWWWPHWYGSIWHWFGVQFKWTDVQKLLFHNNKTSKWIKTVFQPQMHFKANEMNPPGLKIVELGAHTHITESSTSSGYHKRHFFPWIPFFFSSFRVVAAPNYFIQDFENIEWDSDRKSDAFRIEISI